MPPKPTSGLTPRGVTRMRESTASRIAEPELGESGLTRDGLRREVTAAPLSTKQRKNIAKSDFVFPDKAPGPGSYPIPDRSHASNALSRSSGKPEEGAVRRKVCSRYPDLGQCKQND